MDRSPAVAIQIEDDKQISGKRGGEHGSELPCMTNSLLYSWKVRPKALNAKLIVCLALTPWQSVNKKPSLVSDEARMPTTEVRHGDQ
jgi:hypothetical protein